MYRSTRYFQVTPEILLEYDYATNYSLYNQGGDVSDVLIDLNGDRVISTLDNAYDTTRYFLVNDAVGGINLSKNNFVTPISAARSRFIRYYQKQTNGQYKDYSDTKHALNNNFFHSDDFDVLFDRMRLHFTSRNFFGDYDGLIFQASILKSDNTKIALASFVITRMDNVVLNPNPMLLNQKLYTSYIDTKIISTDSLLNYNGEYLIRYDLLGRNERLMKNTPIIFEVFGVRNTVDYKGFDVYNCECVSTINIPCVDSYDNVSVSISEANDGDYFVIKPSVSNGLSFSEFISNMDEDPSKYVILHELSLTEYYVDLHNQLRSEITHKEHYVVNATVDTDGVMLINESGLNDAFLYRPICKHGSKCIRFSIEDVLRIVNTYDNTTIVKTARLDYNKPYKYGKHMNKIYIGEQPATVNVFNRRRNLNDDTEDDILRIPSSSANIKVEGTNKIQTQKITVTAFCETTNIRVSIME